MKAKKAKVYASGYMWYLSHFASGWRLINCHRKLHAGKLCLLPLDAEMVPPQTFNLVPKGLVGSNPTGRTDRGF